MVTTSPLSAFSVTRRFSRLMASTTALFSTMFSTVTGAGWAGAGDAASGAGGGAWADSAGGLPPQAASSTTAAADKAMDLFMGVISSGWLGGAIIGPRRVRRAGHRGSAAGWHRTTG